MKHIKGNLVSLFTENKFDVIIHGCNCFHTMGAGIAGQLVQVYPEILEADRKTTLGDYNKLSTYSAAQTQNGLIINLYTQFRTGKDLSKGALLFGMEKLFRNVIFEGLKVGIPAIGCGIAGGDWKIIGPEIEYLALKYHIDLTYVDYKRDTPDNEIFELNSKKSLGQLFKGMYEDLENINIKQEKK